MPMPPIPLDQLLDRMYGGKKDIAEQTGGLLVDQSDPITKMLTPPPLNFVEPRGQMLTDENPFPLLPAGDVVPFPKTVYPGTPDRFTGPTARSSDYMTGRVQDPAVRGLGQDILDQWMKRVLSRGSSGGAGGDKWPTQ